MKLCKLYKLILRMRCVVVVLVVGRCWWWWLCVLFCWLFFILFIMWLSCRVVIIMVCWLICVSIWFWILVVVLLMVVWLSCRIIRVSGWCCRLIVVNVVNFVRRNCWLCGSCGWCKVRKWSVLSVCGWLWIVYWLWFCFCVNLMELIFFGLMLVNCSFGCWLMLVFWLKIIFIWLICWVIWWCVFLRILILVRWRRIFLNCCVFFLLVDVDGFFVCSDVCLI